jgi:glycolate oxidase
VRFARTTGSPKRSHLASPLALSAPSTSSGPRTGPGPASAVDAALLRELRRLVGDDGVLDDPERLLVYESDGLTQYRVVPAAVVLPRSGDQVAGVAALLHRAGVPLVPRGAGTGLSGGALATAGGVIVGTARMHRILEVDPVNRRARVEPGVVNAALTRATLPHGLMYAPDPSSQSACTLGGNVAENSGGPHCLKYGVTSRYVRALEVVLPTGERTRLGGAGAEGELDLVGVFTGSEGCFGIAVEIEVGLVPVPSAVRTLLGIFSSMEDAGRAVTRIMARGLLPAALEIVDQETIRAVEASVFAAGYPTDAGAALVVEFDGVEEGIDDEVAAAEAACRDSGAREVRTAADEAERAALWRGRKKAFGAMGRIAPDLLVQDATVPRSRLPEVLARIAEIGARHRLRVANVFHAGDGNLHPNLLFDRRDPDELARVEAASREIMAVCIEAGGTITGEHGVGIDKRGYLPLVCPPPVLRAMGEVRRAFDPAGRSNPGKVLPDGWGPPEPRRSPAARPLGAGGGGMPGRTVLEHVPEDLIVRAEGGVTLADLGRRVAQAGQWLPFDPPGDPERLVLEEALLRGREGPLRTGYGRIRDHVLGLRVRTHAGEELELGGRVVKNVAGFDLVRLVVGSGGRLGRILEATLRLFPHPEADRTLWWRGPEPGSASGTEEGEERSARELRQWAVTLGRRLASTGDPCGALRFYRDGGIPGGAGVALRLVGSVAAVEAMTRRAGAAAAAEPERFEGSESAAWWGARAREDDGDPRVLLRLAGLPEQLPAHLALLGPLARAPGVRIDAPLLEGGAELRVPGRLVGGSSRLAEAAKAVGAAGGRLLGPGLPAEPQDPVRARIHREVEAVFAGTGVSEAPGAEG